jgi:hypothetical protein
MSKKQPLKVEVVRGRLVISVGIDTFAFAAENCFHFFDGDKQTVKVTDQQAFAEAVARELQKEAEDGTTPLHLMLDQAFVNAVEDGCDGVEEVKP